MTLRPFVITMGPLWIIAVAGAVALLQGERLAGYPTIVNARRRSRPKR